MKVDGFYSSGEFARMAQVSVRTIRFYDKQNILKPSYVSASGARFYTESDLARLQQILLLKYLGFSLDDIREMLIGDNDYHLMVSSLNMQKKLVQDRMEQLQLVADAIDSTVEAIEKEHQLDWSRMLDLIHLTGMEKSLKDQYQNATNFSAGTADILAVEEHMIGNDQIKTVIREGQVMTIQHPENKAGIVHTDISSGIPEHPLGNIRKSDRDL